MESTSNGPVLLKVHLGGVIAYVPYGDMLWALMPNALLATPARWRATRRADLLRARAPHFGLLVAGRDLINREKTSGDISTIFEPWDPTTVPARASMPVTASPQVLIPLLGEQLDFGFAGNKLEIHDEVREYVPNMKAISKAHSKVPRTLLPEDQTFNHAGLSSAFRLNTGSLTVGSFFGQNQDEIVDFGYVLAFLGFVHLCGRVWHKKIANHLVWTVPLPIGQRSLTIKNLDWESKNETQYVLEAPHYSNVIEIVILHAEVEIPALFLRDPILTSEVRGLPDPDFEAFYGISTCKSKWRWWRVPVPRTVGAGTVEKPCTGGMFGGFQ